jgi:CBS domain-containing protein
MALSSSALNVVIGIDQLRELLTTLERPRHPQPEQGMVSLDAAPRERVSTRARVAGGSFFPFGTLVAATHSRPDGALVFELKSRDFPLQTNPVLVIDVAARFAATDLERLPVVDEHSRLLGSISIRDILRRGTF